MPPKTRVRSKSPALPDVKSGLDPEIQAALLAERVVTEQVINIKALAYWQYCETLLGMTLTPGQRAITSVIFDGGVPDPAYSEKFFGGLKTAPDKFALRTAVAICGRGSGKTRAFCAARAIHLALTVDLSGLPESEYALVAIVGPKQQHSRHTLTFVKGFLSERPFLKRVLKADVTQDCVKITRPDGREVRIEARAASAGGDSVRGPSLAGVFLDEAAFFEGEGAVVNDEEIYRAARPRLVPGGQIIFGSTPWAQEGMLWSLYRDNFGKPDNAIVAKAPTLLVRPSEDTQRAYETELRQDPDNARREYDAEFLSADSERFFPEAVIMACVDATLFPPLVVEAGERCRFGGDFAFASDHSALFGFVERDSKLITCDMDELSPEPGMPLVPSQVVGRFAARMRSFGAKLLIADDWYRQAIEEHLSAHGIALGSAGSPPAANYVVARSLMAQGIVKIPDNAKLLAQLRKVRATIKPGGTITIHQPRAKESGHCDLVSALVCALCGVTVTSTFPKPPPKDKWEAMSAAEKDAQKKRLEDNEKRLNKSNKRVLQLGKHRSWRQLLGK